MPRGWRADRVDSSRDASVAAMPPAPQPAPTGAMPSEMPECWICRDAASPEPLVRPCRCRGSMAGVHASCVEAWVHSHRLATEDPPCCPVCRMPYNGVEHRPGAKVLAGSLARVFLRQALLSAVEALRFTLLGVVLVQYGPVGVGEEGLPVDIRLASPRWIFARHGTAASRLRLRCLANVALGVFLVHKLAVLTAPVPRSRAMQRLLATDDHWALARHIAELGASIVLLGARCLSGELPSAYLAPVLVTVAVPALQLLVPCITAVSLEEVSQFLACLACAPVRCVVEMLFLARRAWRHRRRLSNLLDGSAHLILALLAGVLCSVCRSRRRVTHFLGLHASFLAFGIFERLAVRRLRWRPGSAWWCAALVAVEATSLALQRRWLKLLLLLVAIRSLQRAVASPVVHPIFHGQLWWCALIVVQDLASLIIWELQGGPPRATGGDDAVIVSWLTLLVGLACAVNWGRCVRTYAALQRRNARFVLCTNAGSPSAAGAAANDAGLLASASGVARPSTGGSGGDHDPNTAEGDIV